MSSVTATITSPQRHQQKKREINLTDDPDKLLNEWLGELENLIGVSFSIEFDFYTKKNILYGKGVGETFAFELPLHK